MKKNQFIRKLLLSAVCFAFMINAKAQTINDAFASIADTTGQNNSFTIIISDTTGISEVEVRLGSEMSASDIILHSFNYDAQPSYPYSYTRSGNQIKLGIGSITITDVYYGEVRLKYSNGSWSSPSFQFISN
ncbi:MAG TPA: hypothetical protein VJY62_09320 [Bacteroidia bacterium]|nr:hypothetical protein [Bacteroidia bacterium]